MIQGAPQVGDPVPVFTLPTADGGALAMNDLLGKPIVLLFYSPDPQQSHLPPVLGFRDEHAQFEQIGAKVVLIGSDKIESQAVFRQQHQLPFPVVHDLEGKLSAALGIPAGGGMRKVLLLRPSGNIVAEYGPADDAALAQTVLADARRLLLREEPRLIARQPPLLVVPNALSSDLCRQLIQAWEADPQKQQGEHFLRPGSPLEADVRGCLVRRVIPEIAFATNFQVTRSEGLRVSCQEHGASTPARRRDITSPGAPHRRFTLNVALNDDFTGGELSFPEHAPDHFAPEPGTALVFSSVFLQHVTPIASGRRFVLRDYFFGEAEARAREDQARRAGGTPPAAPGSVLSR